MRAPQGVRKLQEQGLLIGDEPLDKAKKTQLLNQHIDRLSERKQQFLGYQTNQDVNFPESLEAFFSMNLLNLGDGFEEGHYHLNAKDFERAIIHYYARLWHLTDDKAEDDLNYWGYLTPMGATEGNLCALWYAREYLLGQPVNEAGFKMEVNVKRVNRPPVIFFSQSAHYSLIKSCNILQINLFSDIGPSLGQCPLNQGEWPKYVPSNADGSIDIESLVILVAFFIQHNYPVILNFNYGTTFTGALDDVGTAMKQLSTILDNSDETHRKYWVHVDGALAANYMPYVEKAMNLGEMDKQSLPSFDFRHQQVMSICASPYKWIGSPWAFGVFVMRTGYQVNSDLRPNYVGNRDATVAGSRNGLSAVFLWEKLTSLGTSGLINMAEQTEAMAQYAYDQLAELACSPTFTGPDLLLQPRLPFSTMVLFRAPNEAVMNRFTLCADEHLIDGKAERLCHLVILEHVTKTSINQLIDALQSPGAFDPFPQQSMPSHLDN